MSLDGHLSFSGRTVPQVSSSGLAVTSPQAAAPTGPRLEGCHGGGWPLARDCHRQAQRVLGGRALTAPPRPVTRSLTLPHLPRVLHALARPARTLSPHRSGSRRVADPASGARSGERN